MTILGDKIKTRPPIAFMLFSFTFILVGVLTAVKLPCPLSHGTGILKSAPGLGVGSVESRLISEKETFKFTACGNPVKTIRYTYAVNISLTNETPEQSQGSISIVFNPLFSGGHHISIGEGEGEDAVVVEGDAPSTPLYTYVEVPAGATRSFERELSFIDQQYDIPSGSKAEPHSVTVEAGKDIPDPMCSPTGKVPFVEWLQVMVLKMVLK